MRAEWSRDGTNGAATADRPTVVYILGAGRSGSTLCERLLGGFPGFANVGELLELFRHTAPQNERCGCGDLFSDCTFWRGVGERNFEGWESGLVDAIAQRQLRVARQRYLAQLVFPGLRGKSFGEELKAYCDVQYRLYRAIQQESKADVVVDASKTFAPLMALRSDPRIDLRVLHLVRDVRGVSYSWAKSDIPRPQANGDSRDMMASLSVARTAGRWTRMETQAAFAGVLIKPSVTVRYEDLVENTAETVESTLRALGLATFADQGVHLRGNVAFLPSSHGISGNPSRFSTGEITLRPDEQWRTSLGRRDRATATLIGLPALLTRGYFKRTPASL